MGKSLQDILTLTETSRKEVEAQLDQSKPSFHPYDGSIYTGLSDANKAEIYETLKSVTLGELLWKLNLKEYFGPSTTLTTGTTAVAGAPYVIPDKIYADLYDFARGMDLAPLISNMTGDTPGATLKIACEDPDGFLPHFISSGGESPTQTLKITQGTITPRTFSISPAITNDMVEDSQFDLIERHIAIAGRAMGDWSTKMCLFPVMDDHRATATTYRTIGDYNAVSAGGTYVYASDVMEAIEQNYLDGFISDAMVLPPLYGISTLFKGEGAGTPYPTSEVMKMNFASQTIGTPFGINTYVHINDGTVAGKWASQANQYYAGLYTTTWHTLLMNKKYGIQTVRKRWLRMENYSDPIKDLKGMVISARQGHLVAYANAICVISYA